MNIALEPLDVNNWLKICKLSVSQEQKQVFPIANVYWIGISRYEEHTELFAIKQGDNYVGLIGCGYDEDGVTGYINPLMVDAHYQRQGIATEAIRLIMDFLIRKYHVSCIHINHRKENHIAGQLYERLGFAIYSETEKEIRRSRQVEHGVRIFSLREHPERLNECQELLLSHFINSDFIKNQTAEPIQSDGILPQGYYLLKNDKVIGWTGLIEKEVIVHDDISPWVSPLLIVPQERGNNYSKLLLEHACAEAGRLGFKKVYLTTDHIGYYEKYGFREIGLTSFTWDRPTKIYEYDIIIKIGGMQ